MLMSGRRGNIRRPKIVRLVGRNVGFEVTLDDVNVTCKCLSAFKLEFIKINRKLYGVQQAIMDIS
jgi:hypothetical protein